MPKGIYKRIIGINCGIGINKNLFKKGKHISLNTEFKKGCPKPINAYKFPTGSQHPFWKNGETTHSLGYKVITLSKLSKKEQIFFQSMFSQNRCLKHRIIVAHILKRPLLSQESVHHINGIPNDNRPKNLYLFPSELLHRKFHNSKNKPVLTSNLIS